jgi:intracellular sulfur oxidation DsrE/DsrF family protein
MKRIKQILIPFAVLFMLLNAFTVQAGEDFAEKHIVLQISQGDAARQTQVMNVANNIVKAYGQDKVAIEIVAFGSGLKLLFANNEMSSPRIESLQASGVKFSACMNTIAGIKRKTGKEPKLNKHSNKVTAGVTQILDLVDKGYTLIKP